jgi:DNA-binding MarR family transcriptional regulator
MPNESMNTPPRVKDAVDDQAELTAAWQHFLAATRDARQATRASEGLSLAQYRLLLPLRTAQPRRVGELADSAEIRGPTASRMLDGLARQGLIERSTRCDDGRHVHIFLTPEGAATLNAKHDQIEAAWQGAFEQLTDDEHADAARFLRLMSALIRGL